MTKNKHIFLLSALFFLLALVKYAFIADELPTTFIVFEILSFLVVLYIVYYMLHFIETCMHGSDDAKMDKECIRRQAEICRLKERLKKLQAETHGYELVDGVDGEVLLAKLKSKVKGLNPNSVKDIMSILTSDYEVMAAIGYCTNDKMQYVPVETYGVDEDVELAPIELEDGLHAQALTDNRPMAISDIPADYIEVGSGSGSTKPVMLYILPLKNGNSGIVIEIAAFKKLDLVEVWNQLSDAQ